MGKEIDFDPTFALGSKEDTESLNSKYQKVTPTLEELEHKIEQLKDQEHKIPEVDLPVFKERLKEIDSQIEQLRKAA
ncbi:MAG: hypothetical protein AAB657_00570 [Patescibacteria group bacterium]